MVLVAPSIAAARLSIISSCRSGKKPSKSASISTLMDNKAIAALIRIEGLALNIDSVALWLLVIGVGVAAKHLIQMAFVLITLFTRFLKTLSFLITGV